MRSPGRCNPAGGHRAAWLGLFLLMVADVALAQFRPLRFDDDFSAQGQSCAENNNRIACWKDRRIADHVRMSIGGDLRLRYEHTGNPRYGLDRQDRWGVLMQRGSVFADLRLGEHWRGFAQLASSYTKGRAVGPSPVDENRLDPTNLFVEWQSGGNEGGIGMRVGIQELQFGSGRVIDAREGPNVRRSFEAVRAYATTGPWRVDAFTAAPRQNRQGSFDDARSQAQALRGIYATRIGGVSSWDVYALHYEDSVARYVQGVAHERRWTLGTRVFGGSKPWDWNWEFAAQGSATPRSAPGRSPPIPATPSMKWAANREWRCSSPSPLATRILTTIASVPSILSIRAAIILATKRRSDHGTSSTSTRR
jgi:hypothetical protein